MSRYGLGRAVAGDARLVLTPAPLGCRKILKMLMVFRIFNKTINITFMSVLSRLGLEYPPPRIIGVLKTALVWEGAVRGVQTSALRG